MGWHVIFDEYSLERALRDAGAAIDTRIGIDVKPGVFVLGFSWDDTLNRTDCGAAAIAQAQTGNDMSHFLLRFGMTKSFILGLDVALRTLL